MGSDPAQATAEKGRALVMMSAQGLVQAVDAFSRESMPGNNR
jgi:creatinine amidohydrolase/Fe(II)-dependent formamide hydrolase-like protein